MEVCHQIIYYRENKLTKHEKSGYMIKFITTNSLGFFLVTLLLRFTNES